MTSSIKIQNTEIPTWVAGLLIVLVGLSFAFGIVVMGSLTAPLTFWIGAFSVGVTLFLVYLFYRFVLAVEKIANKL